MGYDFALEGACKVKKVIPWIIVGAAVVVIALLLFQTGGSGTKVVDQAGLLAAQAKGAQVVDVRTPGEFELTHVPGAINVPVDQVQSTAASWDRNATFVVYCQTGSRSAEAVKVMESMGFTHLLHFDQGMNAWTGPTDKGGQSTSGGTVPVSGKPVLVEFYTQVCPSCTKMKPVVDALEKQYGDAIEFRRLLSDGSDPAAVTLAEKLGVQYVPTFIFVTKDGVVSSQLVGEQTTQAMQAGLDKIK
jgi:thioredoxin 1